MRTSLRHIARSFPALPDGVAARQHWNKIADAICRFGPVSNDKPVALYGGGDMGRLARQFLRAVGQDCTVIIDRNARAIENESTWRGMPVMHPDEVPKTVKRDTRVAVSLVLSPYVPIEEALLDNGFRDVVPFYDVAESFRHLHPLSNGWFGPPLDAVARGKVADALTGWHDDQSRAHHLQFLAWRQLREEWSFVQAPMARAERYFIPELRAALRPHESFVDAGAYQGSVIEAFAALVPQPFREIVAIEPDFVSREQLKQRLAAVFGADRRIRVTADALAGTAHEAQFHDGLGYASQLSPTGRTRVAATTLDVLGLSPTFIKLHLEGGELPALSGARQTLLANRPLLAVTIYHNADGLWRTPLWLMETLPDYRFLFRIDSWCGTGGVVYGIPEERFGR